MKTKLFFYGLTLVFLSDALYLGMSYPLGDVVCVLILLFVFGAVCAVPAAVLECDDDRDDVCRNVTLLRRVRLYGLARRYYDRYGGQYRKPRRFGASSRRSETNPNK